MRPFFYPSLLSVIQRNERLGARRIPIFEIANTYHRDDAKKSNREIRTLGIALYGEWKPKNWLDASRNVTFYDLKGVLENYLKAAGISSVSFSASNKNFLNSGITEEVFADGQSVGYLGEIQSRISRLWDLENPVYFAEIFLEKVLEKKKKAKTVYKEIPKYPSIERDLAVVVEEKVKAGEIEKEIRKLGRGLITHTELFDLFRGGRIPKGYKNLAFRVVYQSLERTLISEEIQKLHSEIAQTIVGKFQASFQ